MGHLKAYVLLTVLMIPVLCSTCNKRPASTQTTISWFSEDPLSIPYRIRQLKFDKGNLVRNSSFESGKNLIIDSTGVTYRIDGWQKIGDQVQWVNIELDSIYDADEASDSIRAVKIHRTYANETDDPGEGIMSDFIKVIPGNYRLSFHIRLEEITPNRSRLGTRIFDAVNIRLLFYDKNKIEISSKKYDPYRKIYIDNTFQGFAFSNFDKIDDFSWSKVMGKSCNVPFVNGDIPDEARYVKIFLGLKGNGTMWIDQVDFRYSSENFSFLERMNELMDTTLLKQETIIPQPKKVKKLASVPYFDSKSVPAAIPLICVPEDAAAETMQAAMLLKLRMEELIRKMVREPTENHQIRIVTKIGADDLNNTRLLFSIGNTGLFKRFRDILPVKLISGREQGYFVYTTSDLSNIVFLYGNEPMGEFYAATSVVQLFDNKKLMFHNAQIVDFPDFPERKLRIDPYQIKEDRAAGLYKQLLLNKINGLYFSFNPVLQESSPKDLYRILGDLPDYNKLLTYSVFLEIGKLQSALKNAPGTSDILSSQLLKAYLNMMDGCDKIILSPYYETDTEVFDFAPSYNSIEKYTELISVSSNLAAGKHIAGGVACVPVWRNNEEMYKSPGKADIYIAEISNQVPDNVHYLWNGCSWSGYNTGNADLVRIKSIIGANPIWWDKSMIYDDLISKMEEYPARLNLYNLFKPYNNYGIRELFDNIDTTEIYIDFYPESEFDMIRLYTVSDFIWNADNYDPDLSLWKILHSKYGSACARELILFADNYAALLRLSVEFKDPAYRQRFIRKAMPLQEKLNSHLHAVREILGDGHQLVKELQTVSEGVISKIPSSETM